MAEAFRRSRHRPQQADFHWIGTSEEACARREARCVAQLFYDMRLKPLHERSELCGEGLSASGRLWPVDEPRCDLTHVRHQSIRVSVSVTLRADQST